MTVKTIKAENLPRRVPIGYAGTEAAPRPLVHATAYARNGVIVVAMVKGGIVELRPSERVTYSTSPETDGAANLRWCNTCPERHLRYVSAGKTGACYCEHSVRESAARYRAATKDGSTATERAAKREVEATTQAQSAADARLDALMAYRPASREQMIAGLLERTADLFGVGSKRWTTVHNQYGLTHEQANKLLDTRRATVPAS